MDNHEWTPRSAELSDLSGRRATRQPDQRRAAFDPYGPDGRSAERIDELDDWSGPITGSGLGTARPSDRGDNGYWDDRYAERDSAGYPLVRPTERAIPAMRSAPDGPTSVSWHSGSLPAVPADRGAASDRGTALARATDPTRRTGPAADGPILGTFDDDRDYQAVLGWTAIWYGVPIVAYLIWTLTRSGAPKAICVGVSECTSARSDAWSAILHNSLGVIFALLLSFGVAAAVRRVSLSWRALTLGFAASVIGAGIATLLISAV